MCREYTSYVPSWQDTGTCVENTLATYLPGRTHCHCMAVCSLTSSNFRDSLSSEEGEDVMSCCSDNYCVHEHSKDKKCEHGGFQVGC